MKQKLELPQILKYLSRFPGCFDTKQNSIKSHLLLVIVCSWGKKKITHSLCSVSYSFSFISHKKRKEIDRAEI